MLGDLLGTNDASSNEDLRRRLKKKLPLIVAVLEETESPSVPDWLRGYIRAMKVKAGRVKEIIAEVTANGEAEAANGADDRERVSHETGAVLMDTLQECFVWVLATK